MLSGLTNDSLDIEQKRIAALRHRNEQRIKNLLNSKGRMLGVDKHALDTKVADMKAQRQLEEEEKQRLADTNAQLEREVVKGEIECETEKLMNTYQLRNYWEVQKDKTLRREWDLSDPQSLKKQRPVRVIGGDNTHLGVSSAQVMDGEKLDRPDYVKKEAVKLAGSWDEQRRLKDAKRAADKAADADYDRQLDRIQSFTQKQIYDQAETHYIRSLETSEYNKQLAVEKKAREAAAKALGKELERAELEYTRNTAILLENEILSSGGEKKKTTTESFKGMSREQKIGIFAAQERQRKELAAKKTAEKKDEDDWHRKQMSIQARMDELELNRLAEKQFDALTYAHQLKVQAAEHSSIEADRKEMYTPFHSFYP